jgi:flagellar capping protein FliD
VTSNPRYDPNKGGIGAWLSNVVDKFTDAQTGIIFKTTDSLATKTRQLNSRATDLNTLLDAKKNRLILQFANLEVSIAKLQQQGSALSSLTTSTTTSSSGTTTTKTG